MPAVTHTHVQVTVTVGTVEGDTYTAASEPSVETIEVADDTDSLNPYEHRELSFAVQRAYLVAKETAAE